MSTRDATPFGHHPAADHPTANGVKASATRPARTTTIRVRAVAPRAHHENTKAPNPAPVLSIARFNN
jgi:hypothetical protein